MKIELEIDEKEILDGAVAIVTSELAKQILGEAYAGRIYRDTIKQTVRECIRGDIENLSDRAVAAAAKSIENRAVKKLIEKLEAAE
jgi:hypothetical protein